MIKIPFSTFQYEIIGTATNAAPSTTVLQDSSATFQTWRIQVNNTIYNITDGQTATILSIDSQTQLTCTALSGAASWNANDQYRIWVSEPNTFDINIIDTLDFPMYAKVLIANRNNTSQTAYSKYQRVRIIENNTGGNLVLFSGKAETIDPIWDSAYGQILIIEARDNLSELAKRVVRTDYDSSTGYTIRSQLIRRIIDDHVFQASNIDTTQPEFNASIEILLPTDLASKYSGAGKNVLRAILEIAQEDPWDAANSTGFGYDFFLDTDFGASATPSPDFNYFKRDTNPSNPSANGLTVQYLGIAGNQIMQMLHDFSFSTQDRELITRAKVRYQSNAGATSEIDCILINHTAPAPAIFTVGNELRWGANRATVEYVGNTYTVISNDDSNPGSWLNTISGQVITEFTQAGAATGNSATVNAETASPPGSLREGIKQEIEIVSREYEKETIGRARGWAAQLLHHSGDDITRGEFSIITWPTYEIAAVDYAVRAGNSIRVINSLVNINSDMVVTKIDYQENHNTRIARISTMGPTRGRTVIRGIIEQIRDVAEGATWETPAASGGIAATSQLVNLRKTSDGSQGIFTVVDDDQITWVQATAEYSDGSTETIAAGARTFSSSTDFDWGYIEKESGTLTWTNSYTNTVGINNTIVAAGRINVNTGELAAQRKALLITINEGSPAPVNVSSLKVAQLGALTADLGFINAGAIRLASGTTDIVDTTGFTGFTINGARIAGYNAGVLQTELRSSDGHFMAGAGSVELDVLGITINGFFVTINDAFLRFRNGATLYGAIYLTNSDLNIETINGHDIIITADADILIRSGMGGGVGNINVTAFGGDFLFQSTSASGIVEWNIKVMYPTLTTADLGNATNYWDDIYGDSLYVQEVLRRSGDGGSIGNSTDQFTDGYLTNIRTDNLYTVSGAGNITLRNTLAPVSAGAVDLGTSLLPFGSIYFGQTYNYISGSLGDMDFYVKNTAGNGSVKAILIEDGDTPVLNMQSSLLYIGTGTQLRLGTHSVIAAETVSGYILIKDAAGNDRKVAVVS